MKLKMNTIAKLRALRALGIATPRPLCDNGDGNTYPEIPITPAMREWLFRHPEAAAPAGYGSDGGSLSPCVHIARKILRDRRLHLQTRRIIARRHAPHGAF